MFAFPFHKLAYGPKEMARVNALVKSRTLKLNDINNPVLQQLARYHQSHYVPRGKNPQAAQAATYLAHLKRTGPAHIPHPEVYNPKTNLRMINKIKKSAPAALNALTKELAPGNRQWQKIKHFPTTAIPRRGVFINTDRPIERLFQNSLPEPDIRRQQTRLYARLNPKQRSAAAALIRGHELAESQVRDTPWLPQFRHASPDVLMREHNMITTLPQNLKPAGEPLKHLRHIGGEDRFLSEIDPRLQFGKSERLSRHARKRILEQIEKRHFKEIHQEHMPLPQRLWEKFKEAIKR